MLNNDQKTIVNNFVTDFTDFIADISVKSTGTMQKAKIKECQTRLTANFNSLLLSDIPMSFRNDIAQMAKFADKMIKNNEHKTGAIKTKSVKGALARFIENNKLNTVGFTINTVDELTTIREDVKAKLNNPIEVAADKLPDDKLSVNNDNEQNKQLPLQEVAREQEDQLPPRNNEATAQENEAQIEGLASLEGLKEQQILENLSDGLDIITNLVKSDEFYPLQSPRNIEARLNIKKGLAQLNLDNNMSLPIQKKIHELKFHLIHNALGDQNALLKFSELEDGSDNIIDALKEFDTGMPERALYRLIQSQQTPLTSEEKQELLINLDRNFSFLMDNLNKEYNDYDQFSRAINENVVNGQSLMVRIRLAMKNIDAALVRLSPNDMPEEIRNKIVSCLDDVLSNPHSNSHKTYSFIVKTHKSFPANARNFLIRDKIAILELQSSQYMLEQSLVAFADQNTDAIIVSPGKIGLLAGAAGAVVSFGVAATAFFKIPAIAALITEIVPFALTMAPLAQAALFAAPVALVAGIAIGIYVCKHCKERNEIVRARQRGYEPGDNHLSRIMADNQFDAAEFPRMMGKN